MCLAQGHNVVTLVRLVPTAPQSQVKHSTTEPLCSHCSIIGFLVKTKYKSVLTIVSSEASVKKKITVRIQQKGSIILLKKKN